MSEHSDSKVGSLLAMDELRKIPALRRCLFTCPRCTFRSALKWREPISVMHWITMIPPLVLKWRSSASKNRPRLFETPLGLASSTWGYSIVLTRMAWKKKLWRIEKNLDFCFIYLLQYAMQEVWRDSALHNQLIKISWVHFNLLKVIYLIWI